MQHCVEKNDSEIKLLKSMLYKSLCLKNSNYMYYLWIHFIINKENRAAKFMLVIASNGG